MISSIEDFLRVRIGRERGTRFLERKLCKELYTIVAGLFGLYGIVKRGKTWFRAAEGWVRLVDMWDIQIIRIRGATSQGPQEVTCDLQPCSA